ncbi:hypothetical protein ACNHUS_03890 [Actinomycetes bacterium M1A6_2h]
MSRLSIVDEMFLRTHRGLGTPVALQGLWVVDDAVGLDVLEDFHRRLALGTLGRQVVTPRIPGARRRWVTSRDTLPLTVDDTIADGDVIAWADRQGDLELDPEFGVGWRLSTARVSGGGTVVSLVCSHALADAAGLVDAADAALTGRSAPVTDEPDGTDRSDAVDQLRIVGGGTARALGTLITDPARRAELIAYVRDNRSTPAATAPTPNWTPPSFVVDFSAAQWNTVAKSGGGTSNVLFAAVVATATRLLLDRDQVTLSIPVRMVRAGSAANSVSMSEVAVRAADSLAAIRAAAKSAYGVPIGGPAGFPEELLQVVSDRVASRLAPMPGQRDALCSNIGPLPDTLRLGRGTRISTRAIHPRLDAAGALKMRTTLSAYISRFDDRYTMSIVGTDPLMSADLEKVLRQASAQWNLEPRFW